ncbi:SET domain-containing protein SmydA-8 [Lepeophtheirus salmonis]|uniref:Msta, isoform A n=1 Tax=Lepeophtheirus salmonis TaxID=72036 RepID=C1BU56_LEPSM|nr:SET domain-containing protein SmydA-8-like [Lepeophtheirus salmonis]ACO12559.1 msta, isoform A [Lepeophtheirus salmonis]
MKIKAECFYCGNPATASCTTCGLVSFCSEPSHKALHYGHKKDETSFCFPFAVKRNSQLGRHLVATRDIKALEVILEESPLVIGPYISSNNQCLECFKTLDTSPHSCISCNYPFCSQECSQGPWHKIECSAFQKYGHKRDENDNDFYSIITTLRLLSLQESKPEFWNTIMKDMLDHNSDIQEYTPEKWTSYEETVVKKIQSLTKGNADTDTLTRLIGVIDTNGADLNLPHDGKHGKGTGLYLIYSNLNHSCVCNTKTINFQDRRIEMRASVNISKGEQICNQYVRPNKCTLARRTTIKNKWYFDCCCKRCADPTECGSYLGALLCSSCKSVVLPINPLETESNWACKGCSKEYDVEYVMGVLISVGESLEEATPYDPNSYEKILYDTQDLLHPNHYLRIEAELKVAALIGNIPTSSFSKGMPRPAVERKRQCCFHILEVLSLVDPGFNQWRVQILSELTKTKLYLVNLDFNAGLADKVEVFKILQEQQVFQYYLAYNQSIFSRQSK